MVMSSKRRQSATRAIIAFCMKQLLRSGFRSLHRRQGALQERQRAPPILRLISRVRVAVAGMGEYPKLLRRAGCRVQINGVRREDDGVPRAVQKQYGPWRDSRYLAERRN